MSEERNWMFFEKVLHICEEERWHTVYKGSSVKSTWEPPLIISFAGCRSTNRFPLSLSTLSLWQNKALLRAFACKRPMKNGQHRRRTRAEKRQETNFQWADEETVRQRGEFRRAQSNHPAQQQRTDNLVLPRSLSRPTWTRESTSANVNNSDLVKSPWRSWIFWTEPKSLRMFTSHEEPSGWPRRF